MIPDKCKFKMSHKHTVFTMNSVCFSKTTVFTMNYALSSLKKRVFGAMVLRSIIKLITKNYCTNSFETSSNYSNKNKNQINKSYSWKL